MARKKSSATRQRRNKKALARDLPAGIIDRGGGWFELPDGRKVQGLEKAIAELSGGRPMLPTAYTVTDGHNEREVEFLDATHRWYREVCSSSVAAAWQPTDFDLLRHICAPLFDQFIRTSSKEKATELRLWLKELAVTVQGRSGVDWKPPKTGVERRDPSRVDPASTADDPRKMLQVVS